MDPLFTKKVAVIPWAWRIGKAPSWSTVPSSNPMVTTVDAAAAGAVFTAQLERNTVSVPIAVSARRILEPRPTRCACGCAALLMLSPPEQARGLAGERQRAGRGQVDGRFDGREGLDVVLELGAAVELCERVAVIGWAVAHAGLEPPVERAVGTLHRGAGQHRWAAVQGPSQVGDLMVRAVREGAAVADDERGAPGVGAQDVVQPSAGERRVGAGARQLVVLAGHDRQARAVGGRVPGGPGKAEAERVGGRLGQRAVQGLLHVRQQRGLGDLQPWRAAGLADRPVQLVVGQPAHVVEVQRVGGVIRAGDVGVGPVRRLLQVETRIGVGEPRAEARRLPPPGRARSRRAPGRCATRSRGRS